MKTTLQVLLAAVAAIVVVGCSSPNSPQMTTAPSGANSTTHGAPKTGQPSGPDAGSPSMRQ
jgi:uncharacterized lipoprotein